MGLSMGSVELAAKRIAKSGMEQMLIDLAEGIRARRREIAKCDGGYALEVFADEVDKIDPGKYFGRVFP